MYSSASRREHRPRSDISLETRIFCSSGADEGCADKGFGTAMAGEGRAGDGFLARGALP
jgi:hypothetical protein